TLLSGVPFDAALSPLTMTLAGTGDFTGDGKGDLLWRNDAGAVSVWQMDGGTRTGNLAVTAPSGGGDTADWVVVGTGDVNADGKADVIWRNESNGNLGVWVMNGGSVASSAVLATPGNWAGGSLASWQVADVNDYDSDGKADLLLRKDDGS